MRVLAIETSSARGSVALLDDDNLVAETSLGEGSRHGRELVPCVDELLRGDPRGVDLVAVSVGPGSYTGLRVGITFAKTFAVESGTPVVTVSSLDVIAANVTQRVPLCVAVDARLGQVYAALYDADGNKTWGDVAAAPEDAAGRIRADDTRVLGDGLKRYGEVFARAATPIDDESLWWPRAANAGRLGRRRLEQTGAEDPRALVPRYLRRPQAEVKWHESRNASGPRSSSTRSDTT